MAEFQKVRPEEFSGNVFERIGRQWAVLSAGKEGDFNGMTVSWGGMGVLWGRPVVQVYVRPERYTFGYMEREDLFSLSFFPESCRGALNLMGSKSGRDLDKVRAAGLTPVFLEGAPGYSEAEAVLVCRKLYSEDFALEKMTPEVAESYKTSGGVHRIYWGEILGVYVKK